MKNNMKTLVSILLTVALLLSVFPMAFAASPETPALTVTVSSEKSNSATGNATIYVTLKNVSSEPVKDIKVENILSEKVLIIQGKENLYNKIECLEANAEKNITLTVCLNPKKADVNFFERIILLFKVFFMKLGGTNYVAGHRSIYYDDGFSEYVSAEQEIVFGNIKTWHIFRATYTNAAASVGTIAEIVTGYNTAANATKAYKAQVAITDSGQVTSVINKITGGSVVKNIAEDMLPNFYWDNQTETFINGEYTYNTNHTLDDHLPVCGQQYMSILEPAGVSSAYCIQEGTGWKYKIVLAPETVNSLEGVPKYRSQCMDYLEVDNNDLAPFSAKSATVNYTEATITATVNAAGLLETLHMEIPANIIGKLSYKNMMNVDVDVSGKTIENFFFNYTA